MKENIPDENIRNIETYLMATNPPKDIEADFAKLCLEVRRRRFDEIGLEWRKNFSKYANHLPVCEKMTVQYFGTGIEVPCTCGLMSLLERAKFV